MRKDVIDTKLVLVIPNRDKDSVKQGKRDRVLKIVGLVITYVFLFLAAALAFFPFYYMIAASFMDESSILNGRMIPEFASLAENIAYNYSETFTRLNYFHHVAITLLVATSITILQLLTTILAAFAFARLTFKGRDVLFIAFLATMMIPGELLAISNYVTLSNLGLTGLEQTTFQAIVAMIIPLIASSFYIYLLRQSFLQIPNELYLAAKIDGKTDWGYLWKVMVPLASPTLITITILSFISSWNGYIWPSLVVYNNSDTLISVIIRKGALTMQGPDGNYITQYSWQMTASVLTVVPFLIIYVIFRKHIMRGTGRAGIKG